MCFNTIHLGKPKQNIVLKYKIYGNENEYRISKEEQREIKSYCKTKGISVMTHEEAISELKRKQADIFQPLFQPGGNLDEKQAKAKEQIVSIAEIARIVTLTFYINASNLSDSTIISVVSFPSNAINRIKFTKTINHYAGTQLLNCIKAAVDTSLASGYLE